MAVLGGVKWTRMSGSGNFLRAARRTGYGRLQPVKGKYDLTLAARSGVGHDTSTSVHLAHGTAATFCVASASDKLGKAPATARIFPSPVAERGTYMRAAENRAEIQQVCRRTAGLT